MISKIRPIRSVCSVLLRLPGLLVTLTALCFSAAAAAWGLPQIEQSLSRHAIVRADFAQQRFLSGFTKPLQSAGTLLYSRDDGIIWQQQTPFAMTIVIDEDSIVQTMPGSKPQILNAADNPLLHSFSSLLKAMLQADTESLRQFFAIELTDLGAQWQLQLTPKAEPLNKIFSAIELCGDDKVLSIIMADQAGDRTVIEFSHHDVSGRSLDAAEKSVLTH